MAEALKSRYGRDVVRTIGAMLRRVYPAFPTRRFVREASTGLDALELLPRGRHIAGALGRALPPSYEHAIGILVASLGPELEKTEGYGLEPFLYLPHTFFVADRGLDHFDLSMAAQYELTKRFSAEFSIRAFLEREPERTLATLRRWARDPNVHVRRLVSEGTRPRLPWGTRLRIFQQDPRPVLELLELLKDDPEPYVRRSVANNLNDIAKDHPDLVVDVCARWTKDAPDVRRALVRHALRSLVKAGHAGALRTLGFSGARGVTVTATFTPPCVRLGGTCTVTLHVANATAREQRVVVDFAVHFVRSGGRSSRKVFKGRSLRMAPRARVAVVKRVSFAQLTTRRHYAGPHPVHALVNGRAIPVGHIDVRA